MVEGYLRQSPLAHLHLPARATDSAGAGVVMAERPFRGLVNLRGDAGDKDFCRAVAEVLGETPPGEPNTTAGSSPRLFWLGPDEWLVMTAEDGGSAVAAALTSALSGLAAAATDISESRTIIDLSGPRARQVLMKGCGLDVHPRAFPSGACAQTLLGQVGVLLHCLDAEAGQYEITVPRSFAEYLWAWLEDGALEYGLAVAAEEI
ncbi:MAG TPA: sarcosine oxidase subunit gamma family protein [Alphaproteobacteria bacterium]|nr:sarcosine oxidase subunit gamma family protein [Alphaproteobacteria bacterium]MDP6271321.1 sarcosine oxidase subunit gamma family protein [Alphaproteobacteria bacterium]MDP7428811.1 sarcosine oxidase subunit gamma family protein [Alphaproteobacteria bacterium]HJM50447.1 sarcosine oxidase subunit gamma family protein [Alphaproteobacteria bacterium]